MKTDAEINWDVLRDIVKQDLDRWERMAADPKWSDCSKTRLLAKAEMCSLILADMDTLEQKTLERMGLAEHTAAAQEKIIEASR